MTFPETKSWQKEKDRIQSSFFQIVLDDGSKTWVAGLTTDVVNNETHRRAGEPLHFSLHSAMGYFTPWSGYPYGAVFEVPQDSVEGLLRVSDKTLTVKW